MTTTDVTLTPPRAESRIGQSARGGALARSPTAAIASHTSARDCLPPSLSTAARPPPSRSDCPMISLHSRPAAEYRLSSRSDVTRKFLAERHHAGPARNTGVRCVFDRLGRLSRSARTCSNG